MIDPQIILSQLNWSVSKKDYCAMNVRLAFGIKNTLGNAGDWGRYVDTTPSVGAVAWFRPGNRHISNNPAGLKYGHVGVCIMLDRGLATIYDGPNGYLFKCDKNLVNGWISPAKMVELGSTIKIPTDDGKPQTIDGTPHETNDDPNVELPKKVGVSYDDLMKLSESINAQLSAHVDTLNSKIADVANSIPAAAPAAPVAVETAKTGKKAK